MNKIILVAIVSMVLNLFAGTVLLDDFDVAMHTRSYNSLHELEAADTALKSRSDFSAFLSAAGEIITSHELEADVGLRLVHRHFELPEGCVMLEQFQICDDQPSLVTAPVSILDAKSKGAVPSGWIFSSSGIDVFEFSTDLAVKVGLKKLESKPDFLHDIMRVVKDFDFEELMSLSLLRRDLLFAGAGQFYQEKTLSIGSVVQIENGEYNEEAGTRTSWTFGKGPRMLACSACRP